MKKSWRKVEKKLKKSWKNWKKKLKNFNFFLTSSPWSNVWRVSSLKSHSLCQNSKVAVPKMKTKGRYRAARAAKNLKKKKWNLTSGWIFLQHKILFCHHPYFIFAHIFPSHIFTDIHINMSIYYIKLCMCPSTHLCAISPNFEKNHLKFNATQPLLTFPFAYRNYSVT